MRTYIYNSGMAQLSAQSGQGWKLAFTGFKLTDAVGFEFNAASNALPGNVVYTGDDAQMKFLPITNDEVLIQCNVERDIGEFNVGSIQLLVNNGTTDNIPFCVSIGTDKFVKLKTVEDVAVGSKYVYQLMLAIPQLLDRFSFVNLKMSSARFGDFQDENSMPMFAWETIYDQLVLDTHTQTDALTFVLNAWGDYWACPLAVKLDSENMFFKITGGNVGDDHRYVDAP